MPKQTLYLLIGYPGAGKTTVAQAISQETGAKHLWADHERQQMFGKPQHTLDESIALYNHLNKITRKLLSEGKSVIFDTNFNFFNDRENLRQIAASENVETIIIWVTTPRSTAEARAVTIPDNTHNRILGSMTKQEFDTIADKLEIPDKDEKVIKIDGTKLDQDELMRHLNM